MWLPKRLPLPRQQGEKPPSKTKGPSVMSRLRLSVVPVLLSSVLLASCGTVREIVAPPQPIPISLLNCADFPSIPPDDLNDNELAIWMLWAEASWAHCHEQLSRVADLIEETNN